MNNNYIRTGIVIAATIAGTLLMNDLIQKCDYKHTPTTQTTSKPKHKHKIHSRASPNTQNVPTSRVQADTLDERLLDGPLGETVDNTTYDNNTALYDNNIPAEETPIVADEPVTYTQVNVQIGGGYGGYGYDRTRPVRPRTGYAVPSRVYRGNYPTRSTGTYTNNYPVRNRISPNRRY